MALDAQGLYGDSKHPKGKEGIARTIEHLGYIQIDTISVIERAHHHTLWTRKSDYHFEMLHELQAADRRIFEYWGHAASYLPMSDYRFYKPRMRRFEQPKSAWAAQCIKEHGHLMQGILKRIRAEGPLSSKDFKPPADTKRGDWWSWKPAKVALELLFWKGDLMISERRHFQRLYDLTERVLPESIDTRIPDDDELGDFLVHRALSAHGVAREREIRDHIRGAEKGIISKSLARSVDAGDVVPVTFEGDPQNQYFALPKMIKRAQRIKQRDPRLFLLSPFDNFIIQRERLQSLFSFDYTLECYVPAAKRKYGYFVLPILWGEEFIGRIDPVADRKAKKLTIRKMILEADRGKIGDFFPCLAKTLVDFSRFNHCDEILIENIRPAGLKRRLMKLIKGYQ